MRFLHRWDTNAIENIYQLTDNIIRIYWGLVGLRKYLFILMAALLLVACGDDEDEGEELTAHIDIRNEIIGDSYQAMRIIEKAVDADERPDMSILFDYTDKYIDDHDNQDLTEEEFELVMITSLMITRVEDYITVNSERREFESDKEKWYKTLETGEYHKTN